MKKILTIILFLFIYCQLFATKYYIKNAGNNGNTGLSDAQAWQTLAYATTQTYNPNDTIALRSDNIWKEWTVSLGAIGYGAFGFPSSGTNGNPIVLTSYGTGARPKVYGSLQSTTWTVYSGNVWVSATTVGDPYAGSYDGEIYFEELDGSIKWGHVKKATTGALIAEYDWTWVSNHIYVYAATDPDTRYTSIEVPQANVGIMVPNEEYITIDGLEIRYWRQSGIRNGYPAVHKHGLTISNCEIGYIGTKSALAAFGISSYYSELNILYDTIHDCGRRGLSLDIDAGGSPILFEDILVAYCYFYNGFHTTGVDLGNTGPAIYTDIIIRNNLFEDDSSLTADGVEVYPTNQIYIEDNSTGSINNVYIYNNIFKYTNNKCIGLQGVSSAYIYHNTFYGVNPHDDPFGGMVFVASGCTITAIEDNLFYGTKGYIAGQSRIPCVYRVTGSTINSLNYNLYWQTDQNYPIVNIGGSKYISGWAAYKAATGYDANSPAPADPLFINVVDPMEPDSLMISLTSPAKDVGIGRGVYSAKDYRDSLRLDGLPDLGAFEFGASEPPPPPEYPIVTTTIPVIKNSRAVTGGGNVTSDGGGTVSARGVAWSVNPNPTTNDSIKASGTGTGTFTAWIGLTKPGDSYHARAYAQNETGVAYGPDEFFIAPLSVYSDSLRVGPTTWLDSLFVRTTWSDSLIFRTVDGKEFKIVKYIP